MRRGALLLLAVLALAGCGGSSSTAPVPPVERASASYLAAAAAKSTATSSMKVDSEVTMSIPGAVKPVTMTLTGATDNVAKRSEMSFDLSSMLAAIPGASGLGSADDLKMQLISDLGSGKPVVYMRVPFLTKLASGKVKEWIKVDLQEAGKSLGLDLSTLTDIGSDPSQQLQWLKGTSGDVTELGTEMVDGAETTHYRATVDFEKVVNLAPPEQRASVRKSIAALTRLGVKPMPYDVWIDNDQRIRKMTMQTNQKIAGQETNMNMTMRFHDFGSKVDIQLPSADTVSDLSGLHGMGN